MNILITGGTGFIGGHIRDALLLRPELGPDARVLCMTRDPKGKTHGDPRVSFVAGNVRGVTDGSQSPVLERSNVVLMPFPDVTGATYTFE